MPAGICDCSGIHQVSVDEDASDPLDLRTNDFILSRPKPLQQQNVRRDPIQPIDRRPLAFETLRPHILLHNNAGELDTKDLNFDILDCLDSVELCDVDPAIKNKIRELNKADRDYIKELLFKSNG
jgi:hypothetical protein